MEDQDNSAPSARGHGELIFGLSRDFWTVWGKHNPIRGVLIPKYRPCKHQLKLVIITLSLQVEGSCGEGGGYGQLHLRGYFEESFLGGPPLTVTTGDNRDYIRVFLYAYYSTITGWGVLLKSFW